MGLMKKYLNNTRKPEGFLGKVMITGMNAGHGSVSRWGLGCLPKLEPQAIVELGCGGGTNVQRLLEKYPEANVTAIDYSPVSVVEATRRNHKAIDADRCQVLQGNVAELPFPDACFDLATAFETIYFWPGPLESFQQVYRVLKPGGRFMIVNESDGQNPNDEKWVSIIEGMHTYTKEQLKDQLLKAGFSWVVSHHDPKHHRLCMIAEK